MKVFLALAALVALAAATPAPLQDRIVLFPHLMAKNPRGSNIPSGRIVGGVEAEPNEFPHLVALTIDGLYFCGGNIVSENTILTAAHCTDGARSLQVTAGAHDQSSFEVSQQIVTAQDHTEHPDWSSFTLSGDVAVIHLPQALEMTREVDTIALATREPAVGDMVTMAGWGKDCDFGCGVTDQARKVSTPVLDDDVAEEYYGGMDWSRIICIDTEGGTSTCNGDSGGPLMTAEGRLTGVTSFGSIFGCEVGAPACFSAVPSYLDFINENL